MVNCLTGSFRTAKCHAHLSGMASGTHLYPLLVVVHSNLGKRPRSMSSQSPHSVSGL